MLNNTPGSAGAAGSPNVELEKNPIDDHMEKQDRQAEESHKPGLFSVKSDSNLVGKPSRRTGSSPNALPLVSAQKKKSPSIGRSDSEEKRHISFNHRVEQCIALDHQYPDYDDYDEDEFEEEEEDVSSEEEEVLTMKSSPRTSPAISHASSSASKAADIQATIAKLAPTRLKTSEVYPSPSPVVVDPTGFLATRANNGSTVSTYPVQYGYARAGIPPSHGDPTARGVQWDLDDDFNGDFDYFDGPDLGDGGADHVNNNANGPVFNTGDAASSPDASRPYGSHFDNNSESDRTDGSNSSTSPQDIATNIAAPEHTQAGAAAPRGILKHRIVHQNATEDYEPRSLEAEGDYDVLGTSHQDSGSFSESYEAARGDDSRERGRPSQRLGSSASYERIQDAARPVRVRTNSGTSSGHSPTNSIANGSYSSTSPASTSPVNARSGGAQQSFRSAPGAGGKGSASGSGADGLRAGDSAAYGGKARSVANRTVNDHYDSDGQGSYGLASPNFPASPHLDAKDDAGSNRSSQDRDGDRYMYGDGGSYWSDERKSAGAKGARAKSSSPSEAATELSIDLHNIPSNKAPASSSSASKSASVTSPDGPMQVGPTPLNTPTFILARASGKRRSASGSGSDIAGGGPSSPTLPRRTSATGALVAPHNSEPRVPLAHDYVEEDEGGIIGRAVEIVNTARDLIGALLGTGDRGRSWREG